MKSLSRQSDRAIQDLLGVDSPCQMCDLLNMDIDRQKQETAHREQVCWFLIQVALSRESRLRTYKLAAFAGAIGTIMFAYMSLHHGS